MFLKIHKTSESIVIAVCDENLVGRKFEEKGCKLEISKRFYKGKKYKEKEVVEILKTAGNINIVGEKSIKAALKAGVIDKKNIVRIKKIPHAVSCRL